VGFYFDLLEAVRSLDLLSIDVFLVLVVSSPLEFFLW